MSGWFKHHRNLFERAWAKNPAMVSLYEYLHCAAYVNVGEYQGHKVRRGSCPTTRAEMMEATGLSYKQVDSCLKKLLDYGEIITERYNKFTVVTICDYDIYEDSESLFETNFTDKGTTKVQQRNNKGTSTPLYIKEGRIYNNILEVPSKMERESGGELVREIFKLYNAKFRGILPEWQRLSQNMRIKVENCIQRYGRQSVDMVFDQIMHEKFSLGENKTGFIADFRFIFTLVNFEAYLSRYQLRINKRQQKKIAEPAAPVGSFDEHADQQPTVPAKERAANYRQQMLQYAKEHPDSSAARVVAGWEQ